ncbi:UNVERIFIED_CONTAM: P2X purinoceptor 4 [Trichonephila clavipes]
MTSSKFKTIFLSLFEYYTPKIVLIKNRKVGVLNRFVQLAIISYIIGVDFCKAPFVADLYSMKGTCLLNFKSVCTIVQKQEYLFIMLPYPSQLLLKNLFSQNLFCCGSLLYERNMPARFQSDSMSKYFSCNTISVSLGTFDFSLNSLRKRYAIIYNKGYQDFSPIESSVTTKVKGVVFTNYSKNEFNDLVPDVDVYRRIWDTADYVVPPSENNAFFVVTNIVITSNQTQGKCPEDITVPGAKCKSDIDCLQGLPLITGNGVLTGNCVTSDVNSTVKVCEIRGWCPVERDVNPLYATLV